MSGSRLSLNKSRLTYKRKHDKDEPPPSAIPKLEETSTMFGNETFLNYLDQVEALEREASHDHLSPSKEIRFPKGNCQVQGITELRQHGLSPIPNEAEPLSARLRNSLSPAQNKSLLSQRCLIPQTNLADDSLQDSELLAIPDPETGSGEEDQDLFDDSPKASRTLQVSGYKRALVEDEEDKPWDVSVYVKSPNSPERSFKGLTTGNIAHFKSPNQPQNKSKWEVSMQGLADINWDESMLLGDRTVVDNLDSPKSLSFSQKFRQHLINNNINLTSPCRMISKELCENNSFFGLSDEVKQLIEKFRGIKDLYDWQKECLSLPEVLQRRNLVYALPTSGGKTLVAEILLLKEILINKRNTLFILPYVSIVQEKVRALSQLAIELEFFVEEYAGGKGCYPPKKHRSKNSVFVATIEKALGLVHCLINESRLHEIGLVVVDELHLLGEGSRGATLESVLTNLQFSQGDIQIVGMSATIGNLDEIAMFLNAKTYTGDFRPVELKEYLKCGQTIYSIQRDLLSSEESPMCAERTLPSNYSEEQLRSDPDQIGTLVAEVVPKESCLVFCPSRKNCENVAILICQTMSKDLKTVRVEEKRALYKALVAEGNGHICPTLIKTLPYGVAYHHSGLTTAERRLLEEAFLAQTLCVICCTSTLAAGVNLPARRVILRSPYIGIEFIDLSRYKQMVGRAGRAGFGGVGESILMCLPKDVEKVLDLLRSNMTETLSYLDSDGGAGLKALVMHSVSLKLTSCRSDIHAFLKRTLLWVQASKKGVDVLKLADECIKSLVSEGGFTIPKETPNVFASDSDVITALLPVHNKGSAITKSPIEIGLSTPLNLSRIGEAAVKGSFDMITAHQLYDDLKLAQEKLVLLNHLHLLFIVTPYNMVGQVKYGNQVYFNVFMDLSPEELKVASTLGITEAVAMSVMKRQSIKNVRQEVVDRFFLTLMLYDLWHQKSIWDVSNKFQTSRGQVFSLLQGASSFASSVLRFCEVLEEFWCFKLLLETMVQRLSHCCALELLPLMELPAVKIGRARQLYNAGYRSLRDVAAAEPNRLVRDIDHMPRKAAFQIVAAAKLLLLQKAEALREEASEYLEGIALHIKEGISPPQK